MLIQFHSVQIRKIFTDGQKVYFIANDGTTGRELWSTDGTNAGTQLVKDINVGNANSVIYAGTPNGMVEFNNEVYSFGYNGTSVEFFKTNGSLAGTTVIKTLPTIIGVSYSYVFNGKIYFVGFNSVGGSEFLYESDGTTAGTFQIAPIIATYTTSPNGFNMLAFGNEVYIPAYFGSQGVEFCKLTPSLSNEEWNVSNVMKVYPNPTNGIITVNVADEWVDGELSVTNLQGQIVLQSKLNSVNELLDFSELHSGMYLLTIQKKTK